MRTVLGIGVSFSVDCTRGVRESPLRGRQRCMSIFNMDDSQGLRNHGSKLTSDEMA